MSAVPVIVSTDTPAAGPVLRVIAATDVPAGMVLNTLPAVAVRVLSDADIGAGNYDIDGNVPMVMVASNIVAQPTPGQKPIPVYVVSGSFAPSAPADLEATILATSPANLVAAWPLNEDSGSVANDIGPNALHGVYSASGLTLGQSVTPFVCPTFAPGTTYVDLYSAGLPSLFNGVNGTLSVFVRPTASGARVPFRMSALSSDQVHVGVHLGGKLYVNFLDAGGVVPLPLNAWTHLAFVWRDGNLLEVFRNGARVTVSPASSAWNTTILSLILSGLTTSGVSNRWVGQIAFPAIWNTPLDETQVANLYLASGI